MARDSRRGKKKMSERDVRRRICYHLTRLGWRWVYWPDSRMVQGSIGFPDITCVKGGVLFFIECKRDGQKLRAPQQAWCSDLEASGARVCTVEASGVDQFIVDMEKLTDAISVAYGEEVSDGE